MKPTLQRRSLLALLAVLLLCTAPSARAQDELTLTFQLESGFYRDEQMLLITCSDPDADIYYTTDGSVPDDTDLYFDEWIDLPDSTDKEDPLTQLGGTTVENYLPQQDFPSAHVIRAIAMAEDGRCSKVVSGTYFIGYDRKELYGDMPIVSLMTEPDGFFDMETGIYVLGNVFLDWDAQQTSPYEDWEVQGNFSQRGRAWERPVAVEFLPSSGDGFLQDMGVRIKGGVSRSNPQKSLRLIARDDYGEKNVKYPIFPNNLCEATGEVLAKYKSFTLRNGGNDGDFAKIRDPFIRRMAEGMRFEVSDTRPVIAFINGEYWGLYTLTEEYSDNYFDYHYGIPNDNVVTFKNGEVEDGEESDADLYWTMQQYIAESDMADPACYEKAAAMLDMDSFADYLALTLYIGNEDGIFDNNNWQMWRVREPGKEEHPYADGKWRMILFDVDYTSGVYTDGKSYTEDAITPALFAGEAEAGTPAAMARSLLCSPDFRKKLILALCDVRSQYFAAGRAIDLVAEMTDAYLPYAPDTFRRFGPEWIAKWDPAGHASSKMKSVETFFRGRFTAFPGMVARAFKLENPTTVNIQVSDGAKGCVYLNGRNLPITGLLSTKYFSEYPITVTAVPAEGAKFVRWEVSEGDTVLSAPGSPTTQVTFYANFTLTAIFE